MPGIRMSIRTTSGFSRRASSTASAPVAASPTEVRSGAVSTRMRKLPRTRAWSSATSTRIVMPRCPRQREPGGDPEAASRQRRGPELPAVHADPLPHSDDAVAGAGLAAAAGSRPLAAVGHLERQRVLLVGDGHPAAVRCRVLDHVGDRLLDHPVRGQVQPGGKPGPLAADVEVHPDAGLGGPLDQAVQVRQPGAGTSAGPAPPARRCPRPGAPRAAPASRAARRGWSARWTTARGPPPPGAR